MFHELFPLAPQGHSHTFAPSAEDTAGTCTHCLPYGDTEALTGHTYGALTLCHPWAKLAFINPFHPQTALRDKGY